MVQAVDTRVAERLPAPARAPAGAAPSSPCLYETPNAALAAVRQDFLYWTGWLTDTSLQLSYAVIAANWAVFGSVDGFLSSFWSKLSLGLVIVSLGLNVAGAKWMGEMHRARVDYAESDTVRWQSEFEKTAGKRDPWPFTGRIEKVGRVLREARTYLPILASLSFLIGLLAR